MPSARAAAQKKRDVRLEGARWARVADLRTPPADTLPSAPPSAEAALQGPERSRMALPHPNSFEQTHPTLTPGTEQDPSPEPRGDCPCAGSLRRPRAQTPVAQTPRVQPLRVAGSHGAAAQKAGRARLPKVCMPQPHVPRDPAPASPASARTPSPGSLRLTGGAWLTSHLPRHRGS